MKYAVPRRNRQYASWPELPRLARLAADNRALRDGYSFRVLDLPFAQFADAPAGMQPRPRRDTPASWASSPLPVSARPLIATGHQPDLFHPGVWIKNFLTARLASAVCGSSLNVIVDNDVPKHLGLVLPVSGDEGPRRLEVPMAERRPELAFEEYPPLAHGDRLRKDALEAARGEPFEAGVRELADRIEKASGHGRSLGDVTSAARIAVGAGAGRGQRRGGGLADRRDAFVRGIRGERRSRTRTRFRKVYNAALAEYRAEHGIRSVSNPMTDLAGDDSRHRGSLSGSGAPASRAGGSM